MMRTYHSRQRVAAAAEARLLFTLTAAHAPAFRCHARYPFFAPSAMRHRTHAMAHTLDAVIATRHAAMLMPPLPRATIRLRYCHYDITILTLLLILPYITPLSPLPFRRRHA